MSEVKILARGNWMEFTRPSTNQYIISEDDGLDCLNVAVVEEGLQVSMRDDGASGEYARSWADIVLDRAAALELRGFIDEWLDSPVSLD